MKNKLLKLFKKKWIAALRSDEYLQATSVLYSPEESSRNKKAMCCLGVAESICGTLPRLMKNRYFPADLKNPKSPKLLHGADDPKEDVADKLSRFNDSGKSFKWIASYIERYL